MWATATKIEDAKGRLLRYTRCKSSIRWWTSLWSCNVLVIRQRQVSAVQAVQRVSWSSHGFSSLKKLKGQASAEDSSSDQFEELRKWTMIAERMATEASLEVQVPQFEVIVCRWMPRSSGTDSWKVRNVGFHRCSTLTWLLMCQEWWNARFHPHEQSWRWWKVQQCPCPERAEERPCRGMKLYLKAVEREQLIGRSQVEQAPSSANQWWRACK